MLILIIAAIFLAVIKLLLSVYFRRWDKGLTLELRFPEKGVSEGEQGELIETITNAKLLPLLFASVSFRAPRRLAFYGKEYDHDIFREDRLTIFSFEQITRKLPFTALRRGFYTVGESNISTNDLLFREKYIRHYPAGCTVLVYPRVKGVENFPIDFRRLTGQVISRRSMIEDPFFFRGIRDWAPTDSMRRINWNATARTGGLKVNQFESTHSQNVLLLLDFDGYNKSDHEELREDIIRIAAYLSGVLLKAGIPTGMTTNAFAAGGTERAQTKCRNGRSHYDTLLSEMALIDADRLSGSFGPLLDSLGRESTGTQFILISYRADQELDERVLHLSASGRGISWILLRDKGRRNDYRPRSGAFVCEVNY